MKLFADALPRTSSATLCIAGVTDNRGNSFLLGKSLTCKFPLNIVLMELVHLLSDRDVELDLKWRPREENVLADALTNERFEAFEPRLRLHVEGEANPFPVIDDMSRAAEGLFSEVAAARAARRAGQFRPVQGPSHSETRCAPGTFRDREPW
jgi:hypothetical protein